MYRIVIVTLLPLLLPRHATVTVVQADFEFTALFYEFDNPFGLQCSNCSSNGQPVCCDDTDRTRNCTNVAPYTCDTRFRFMLRPYGAPIETAPGSGFPYFTPSNAGNSHSFPKGPRRFLALQNPYTISQEGPWTGRIQFLIDAVDKAVNFSTSGLRETEAIIDRFPIDLILELTANFTARNRYPGTYNLTTFDISFRIECSENCYGSDCTQNCSGTNNASNDSDTVTVSCEDGGSCSDNLNGVTSTQGSNSDTQQTVVLMSSLAVAILTFVLISVNVFLLSLLIAAAVKNRRKARSRATTATMDQELCIADTQPNVAYHSHTLSDSHSKSEEAIYKESWPTMYESCT